MPIINKDFLKKYKKNCNVFVEIGSFVGDTIQLAIEAGFSNILSVELNEQNYKNCVERFKHVSDIVTLFHGASEDLLWQMIEPINEKIMFWVDGHYSGSGEGYVTSKGSTFSSIHSDLMTVMKHPIKNHIIMVDDVRDLGTQNMDFITLDDVILILKKINSRYKIKMDTGNDQFPIFENDILVAWEEE